MYSRWRCPLIVALSMLHALAGVIEFTYAAEHVSRPNIILFLVDDMGIMDSSVPFLVDDSGNPKRYPLNDFYRTPNMQRLADRGIRFSQFYAMSVCSPTRVSIMTGQNAARHRTTNWINPDSNNKGPKGPANWNWHGLSGDDVTLPRLLQSAGYRTIHVGKGHFGPRAKEGSDPRTIGFDVNVGGSSIGQPGSYYGRDNFGGKAKKATHAVPGLEAYHGTDTFLTEALTREAKKHMKDAVNAGVPFYLNMAQYAVHSPFQADDRFVANYRDEADKPLAAKAFATLIEGMDKSLGDLMDHLDELGVAEDTLIIMLGDNGTDAPLGHEHAVACAAPLRGKKGSHYEGGMRVPMIAAWARRNNTLAHQSSLPIPAAAVQTQMASVVDLFPTVLKVAGVDVPAEHVIDGSSLHTLLRGDRDKSREQVFLMHYPHGPHRSSYWTSLRVDGWKVIYHYFPSAVSGNSHYQLFDLRADPFEQTDLSSQQPQVLDRMMVRLAEELERHNALYPMTEQGESMKPRMVNLASHTQ